ncbi:MAG: DNA recombination protein RmuC [Candidatus Saccharimonadales bacterium]
MNVVLIIVVVVVALIVLVGAFYFLAQKFTLQLTKANDEQRKGNQQEAESGIKEILDNHQKLLNEITKGLKEQLESSNKEVGNLKNQNVAIREQLANTAKVTEGLQVSTEGLRRLLSNNKLRGKWGEQVAEDLLLAAGFVEKVNFVKQTSSGEGIPDFTILLPDGSKLNVDAKFPFDDLMAYQDAKTEAARNEAIKNFGTAVKTKVKSIANKDYINPEANTLDFVVMFIPNEMIFSFIYEKLPDINEYASEHKVVLAGPFGFTAVLRLVLQAYKNFKYEKGLQQIFGLISKFQSEYEKFGENFERLGKQLDTVQKTYLEVNGARNKALTRIVDQISDYSENQEAEEKAKEIST